MSRTYNVGYQHNVDQLKPLNKIIVLHAHLNSKGNIQIVASIYKN